MTHSEARERPAMIESLRGEVEALSAVPAGVREQIEKLRHPRGDYRMTEYYSAFNEGLDAVLRILDGGVP